MTYVAGQFVSLNHPGCAYAVFDCSGPDFSVRPVVDGTQSRTYAQAERHAEQLNGGRT